MDTWQIVLLIVGGILLVAGLTFGLVYLILALVQMIGGTIGGWRRLAEVYRTTDPASGRIMKRETVKIGAVVYKRCVTLGVATEGLYISTWGKSALIPWNAFTQLSHTTLYWQRMPMLTVGDPPIATIVLPDSIFSVMKCHLARSMRDQE